MFCVDAEDCEEHGDDVSEVADCESYGVGFAGFVADHGWAVAVVEDEADGYLHDMVADDGFKAFPFCDVVSLKLLFRGVDSMVAEESVGVEDVEECSGDGVDDCW